MSDETATLTITGVPRLDVAGGFIETIIDWTLTNADVEFSDENKAALRMVAKGLFYVVACADQCGGKVSVDALAGLMVAAVEVEEPSAKAYENARQRDAVIAVMHRMKRAAAKDFGEYERRDDERASFCDGGATRLTFAIEELRKALCLPCEGDDMSDEKTPASTCDDCHFGTQFIEDPPRNPAKLSALLADGWVGCPRSLTLSRPCPCRRGDGETKIRISGAQS